MGKIRVVGIGSPHGDDQVGWRLIDLLKGKQPPGTELAVVHGAVRLANYLDNCGMAILVDACQTGAVAGTITRLEWPDARIGSRHGPSTHGFCLGSALELAQQLGQLPRRVVVYGVEMESCEPGTSLSPAVESALPEVARRIIGEVQNRL